MKRFIISFLAVLVLATYGFSFSPASGAVFAAAEPIPGTLGKFCEGATADKTICQINAKDDPANKKGILDEGGIFRKVLWVMSWITGLLAAVFIIVGGVKFATSKGESDSVKSARNMILYSCVGIAVVALSNVIINFVLSIVAKANT